jgi:hypothetical protein
MKKITLLMATMVTGCTHTPEPTSPPPTPAPARPPMTAEQREEFFRGGRPKPVVDEAAVAKHPLGTIENPVRVDGPAGEHAYLGRLRCPDGSQAQFERTGSVGTRSPWGYILDRYEIRCASGEKATLFMDMYHRTHQEDRAVPGFTLTPRAPG